MNTVSVLDDILRREAWPKVTNVASDRGKLTRGGVTFTSYNAWRALHKERPLTPEEFIEITEDEARAFYEDMFLRPFTFIDDGRIFAFLVDWAVNSGVATAARAFQAELHIRGLYFGPMDGIPGLNTQAAWQSIRSNPLATSELEVALIKARQEFYLHLGLDGLDVQEFLKAHPKSQLANLRGWLRRNTEFLS